MSDIVVSVESRNGYPGGNEPATTVWVRNIQKTGAHFRVGGEGYGNAGYDQAVADATQLAYVLGAPLKVHPMGKFLSQLTNS